MGFSEADGGIPGNSTKGTGTEAGYAEGMDCTDDVPIRSALPLVPEGSILLMLMCQAIHRLKAAENLTFRRGQCFFGYAKAYRQFISGEFGAVSDTARMIAGAGKSDGSTYPGGTMSNVWNTCSHAMDRGVKFALGQQPTA